MLPGVSLGPGRVLFLLQGPCSLALALVRCLEGRTGCPPPSPGEVVSPGLHPGSSCWAAECCQGLEAAGGRR